MPQISFLLPIYNGATYLRETMDSLLSQTFDDYNIVIINDGSTDETEEIVTSYSDARIDYRAQDNMGLVATLNAAFDVMDCEYVARIDADDICYPQRLERQLDFVTFTDAVAVSCRAMNIDEAGNEMGENAPGIDFRQCDPLFVPAREPYLPHPFLFARLDILQEAGGFRQVHLAEDADLCWKLFDTHRIALQEEVLGKYRVHTNSVSSKDLSGIRVQSFYSQLAALNADRRRRGLDEIWPDLSFAKAKAKKDMASLLAVVPDEDEEFSARLAAMSYWKYLDIWHWRKYPLDRRDAELAIEATDRIEISDENKERHQTLIGWIKNEYPDLL